MLALNFANKADYDLIRQDDTIDLDVSNFAPGVNLVLTLHHADGTSDRIEASHTYNAQQIEWFHAGSALNKIREEFANA